MNATVCDSDLQGIVSKGLQEIEGLDVVSFGYT